MDKDKKAQLEEYNRTVAVGNAISDGYDSVMNSLNCKGVAKMVRESFIIPCDMDYTV